MVKQRSVERHWLQNHAGVLESMVQHTVRAAEAGEVGALGLAAGARKEGHGWGRPEWPCDRGGAPGTSSSEGDEQHEQQVHFFAPQKNQLYCRRREAPKFYAQQRGREKERVRG